MVFAAPSGLALRALRDGASLIVSPEVDAVADSISDEAEAALALVLSADLVGPGIIVRLCCSMTDATADVRVGSGLSIASQR